MKKNMTENAEKQNLSRGNNNKTKKSFRKKRARKTNTFRAIGGKAQRVLRCGVKRQQNSAQ